VVFSNPKKLEKAVDKFRPSTKVAFRKAIEDMRAQGPNPLGWYTKPLKGDYRSFMSLRLDYRHRMIYQVSHGILTITVIEVSTREGAY
jgi:mRNA-degrading endonuclease RelE of RelBE toxin-antitoxin system